jgi:hypothetical protein
MTMSQKYDYKKIAFFLTKDPNPLKIRSTEDEALVVVISTGQKYAYTPQQVLDAHYAITPIPKKPAAATADPVKADPAKAKPEADPKPAAKKPAPKKPAPKKTAAKK